MSWHRIVSTLYTVFYSRRVSDHLAAGREVFLFLKRNPKPNRNLFAVSPNNPIFPEIENTSFHHLNARADAQSTMEG